MTLEELEQQFLVARFASDYKTGRPKYETDARYRAEVDRMQFELELKREESRQAALPKPSLRQQQADLELLNHAMRFDKGRAYFNDAQFRERVENLRAEVMNGGTIPAEVRAATEADLARRAQ